MSLSPICNLKDEVFRTYVEGLEELKHTLETLADRRDPTTGRRFKAAWTEFLNR
jgi:hypothetical protein